MDLCIHMYLFMYVYIHAYAYVYVYKVFDCNDSTKSVTLVLFLPIQSAPYCLIASSSDRPTVPNSRGVNTVVAMSYINDKYIM
jgi:hypothetical protein